MKVKHIRLRGVVQGVGMRPALWRLAQQLGVRGSVCNDGQGVLIEAWASEQVIEDFVRQIPLHLPAGASLETCLLTDVPVARDAPAGFSIVILEQPQSTQIAVAADSASCADCLADIADPANRRYRYAFTHCAQCGPRWSLVRRLPYERSHTSMAEFPMCVACQSEYQDPANRRFHAQSICCPECGPRLFLADQQGVIDSPDVLQQVSRWIQQGKIVAIKGLGGFQLACDALNADAVLRLRQRKQREAKPLALMAADLASVQRYAQVNSREQQALLSPAAPIVLLHAYGEKLPDTLAMGSDRLGFMLPSTPLHSLLMAELSGPIVLTSGNRSDEPPCLDNQQALDQLAEIADYWLLHDRAIEQRLDDSVVCDLAGQIRVLRRARGYVPAVLNLPEGLQNSEPVLALGGELKNSFCCVQHGQALLSPYLGDLEQAGVYRQYQQTLEHYQQHFVPTASRWVTDLHPGYLSSQYAQSQAGERAVITVQHHHAHLAACLAEHGIAGSTPPVLGAIFDGLGLGDDGTLWGSEFLLADYRSYQRVAHFPAIALPGGSQAIRQPWRNTYAHLRHYFDWQQLQTDYAHLPLMQMLAAQPLATLDVMIEQGINSPLCSSAGRWFDAFAAALGLHAEHIQYEGQAAIALETVARTRFADQQPYVDAWAIQQVGATQQISWQGLWQAVLVDLTQQTPLADMAARIHHSLIEGCTALLLQLSQVNDVVVLSGGVMQNQLLLEGLHRQLRQHGRKPLIPQHYPLNDGGLALGQAAIAIAKQNTATLN